MGRAARKSVRAAALVLSAALLVGAWAQAWPVLAIGADLARVGYAAWAKEQQAQALERETIPEPVYRERVARALAAGDLLLLESYLAVGDARGYALDPATEAAAAAALARARNPTARGVRALDGCLRARGHDLAALGGQLACDLLVIGDVRDLVIQGWLYGTGGEPDPVIAALAGLGLALEGATVASGGSLLAANLGVATLKIARRTGRLTRRFADALATFARRGDKAALEATARGLGQIAERTSPGTALRLLAHVEAPADVARLERAAAIGGKRTLAWSDSAGRRVLDLGTATAKAGVKAMARLLGLLVALAGALVSLAAALALPRFDPARRLLRRLGQHAR